MGSIENKCFTRKIYDLGKTRVLTKNKTKKNIKKQLLEHPYKYFSFKELYDLTEYIMIILLSLKIHCLL